MAPFSINRMYYANKMSKTAEAQKWTLEVFHDLSQPHNQEKLEALRAGFDPKQHGFNVSFTMYFPVDIFWTKTKRISSRTFDLSNIEKPLIDLLFLPKYFDKTPPFGCKNLNIDDKYLMEMSSRKLPHNSPKHRMLIDVEIKDLPACLS